jgi:hypothetical protein
MRPDTASPAITPRPVAHLRRCARNARTHSARQIRQIADSIAAFGFTNPVLIGDDDEVIAGHARIEAAKLLGLPSVPTLRLSGLDAAQRRAYMLADNKLALGAGWDRAALATELQALVEMNVDVGVTGFLVDDFEIAPAAPKPRQSRGSSAPARHRTSPRDSEAAQNPARVTRAGDTWLIGRHRLTCGDHDDLTLLDRMLEGERVVFIAFDTECCDRLARRFRDLAGHDATLADTGQSFAEVAAQRGQPTAS